LTAASLQITEIFHSIQGESSRAGEPCVFIRLTGCTLRCTYCDTQYAYFGGEALGLDAVVGRVREFATPLVEVTGGEPLEQVSVFPLLERLLKERYTVMLETGGHVSIREVPREVIKIIDVKTPDSGEPDTFLPENVELAAAHDEFKFVISSERDYTWSREFYSRHLAGRGNVVLFSPAHGTMGNPQLSGWILADRLPVRFQLQLHKYIWGADAKGV
jgi:7-carboxy-7-deazaguanine synthase